MVRSPAGTRVPPATRPPRAGANARHNGIVIASIIQIFVQSSMMSFVLACASVVVFAGLTAYDTQKLREMHAATGYSSAATVSIVGALTLYLDFINLFLALLRLFGSRRD